MTAYDYVIVGGGTAGCILATRLSEDTDVSVCLVEAGPSDLEEPRALEIARWVEMLEGAYDLDYRTTAQRHAHDGIRHARAQILGGCSSHNNMIAWHPSASDLARWVERGAAGWDAATMAPYRERLQTQIVSPPDRHRNPFLLDLLPSAANTLGVPHLDCFDAEMQPGSAYFAVGYDPDTGRRSSSSLAYLHPVLSERDNLTLVLGRRVLRIVVDNGRAVGVETDTGAIGARREVIVSAGAIDSPRLLLLSGIGAKAALEELGIACVADLPGVGENLQDHCDGLLVFEAKQPIPDVRVSDWEAGLLVRRDGSARPVDLMFHFPLRTWAVHAERLGFATPEQSISFTPNVPRPRSRGRVALVSPDPADAPLLDPRYLSDPDGYDIGVIVDGIRAGRRIAAHPSLAAWIGEEAFPGPGIEGARLEELARQTINTVYHPVGTCRMGAADDAGAVCDPTLRVRGVERLRVVDASVFPLIPSVNPVITVQTVAERAADLIRT